MISIACPCDFSARIYGIIAGASNEELVRFADGAECSISLAAGWEQLLRAMSRQSDEGKHVLDEVVTKRFLDLMKQKVTVDPPVKWTKAIRTATWHGQGPVTFEMTPNQLSSKVATGSPTVIRDDKRWIVQYGGKSWAIPAEDRLGPVDEAAVASQGGVTYVALYGWPPIPYRLYALKNGDVLWGATIFAADHLMNYSGLGVHVVELKMTQDRVTIYGLSGNIAYLEVFDAKTGDPVCRFSTLNLADID